MFFQLSTHPTEVGRAFLNPFQKWFLDKVFLRIKIASKFKFYIWLIISGSKSPKSGQKLLKKATIWTYTWFFSIFLALANLIPIKSYNMRKKSGWSLYDFRTYFFTFWKVQAPFSNLLTTANNYRNFLYDFFEQINHWVLSISMQKCAENLWFYVVKLQNFGPKMAILLYKTF